MDINNVPDFEKFMVCSQGINSIINKIVTENVANTDTNTKVKKVGTGVFRQ